MAQSSPPRALFITDAVLVERFGEFMTPSVKVAFQKIKEWAEHPSFEASAPEAPDNGYLHPDQEQFKATGGLPWLAKGHRCVLSVWGGESAALAPMAKQGWVHDIQQEFPTRDEVAFRFTQAGAEAFADLMYPGLRLAHHRALDAQEAPAPRRPLQRRRS
jgi:hypothetical protein